METYYFSDYLKQNGYTPLNEIREHYVIQIENDSIREIGEEEYNSIHFDYLLYCDSMGFKSHDDVS